MAFFAYSAQVEVVKGELGRSFHALHDPPGDVGRREENRNQAEEQPEQRGYQTDTEFLDVITEAP